MKRNRRRKDSVISQSVMALPEDHDKYRVVNHTMDLGILEFSHD